MRAAPLAGVALAIVSLAAGCGGGKSDEDTIRGIVEEGNRNPVSICDNLTRTGLRQLGGSAKCRELARSPDNRDPGAKITGVRVDGDRATVKLTGQDGARQTIHFRKEDGKWRVSPG
jgi:hypothetical protein